MARPTVKDSKKRVRMQVYLLPSTIKKLEREGQKTDEKPSRIAARILDLKKYGI